VTISEDAPRALVGWSSVNRLTGQGRWIAIAPAGLTALGERTSQGQNTEWTPLPRRVDEWGLGS
jgi:hypothetical protein